MQGRKKDKTKNAIKNILDQEETIRKIVNNETKINKGTLVL